MVLKELRMADALAELVALRLRGETARSLGFGCLPGLLDGGRVFEFEDGSMISLASWGRDGWGGLVRWVDGDFADTQAGKLVESTGVLMPLRDGEYTELLDYLARELTARKGPYATGNWNFVREVVPVEVRDRLCAWPRPGMRVGDSTLMFLPDWQPEEVTAS